MHPSAADTDRHVLHSAAQWLSAGSPVWLATVVATYGSSPRPVGSLLAWSADFGMAGSLSGGCVEEDLIARLRAGQVDGSQPRLMLFGDNAAEQARYRLPCGGHLQILLQRLGKADLAGIQQMLTWLSSRAPFVREVSLHASEQRLSLLQQDGSQYDCQLNDEYFIQPFQPAYQLLIIGAGEVARHLAALAQPAGFAVTICDHREEFLQGFDAPGAELRCAMPDSLISQHFADSHSAIVALAHDPRLDDMAMLDAFDTQAFYIGAMGSLATSAKRRERLAGLGVSAAQLQRLHAPIGLNIGSKTPYEIALSILAHLLAERPQRG
ncbi:MAG: XdhC family protein [Saccharospirillaceae bacterium]|nr:XdhC family protein [Saccharospirillaceae bacterium]